MNITISAEHLKMLEELKTIIAIEGITLADGL
jgi:hypothetical protein